MCCFWDCRTSECYLHGLVLQVIWQFSQGPRKGIQIMIDVYFPWVRWNWGPFPHGPHRVLLLIAFFKVRRGFLHSLLVSFYMLVGANIGLALVLKLFFCLLRSWRTLWPSWDNQIVPFKNIPSKAVSIVSIFMTKYYVAVFCVNVGFSSKACNSSGALQNHLPLHPHSSHIPLSRC